MDIKTIAISNNENTLKLINLLIEEYGKFEFLNGFTDFSQVYNSLSKNDKVLIIVDISDYQEQGLNFVAKITSDFPNCKIITISDKSDTNLIIRAMRVGAIDFVPLPIIKNQIFNAFEKVYNDFTNTKQKKSKCKILSIYSSKGGVGKTSVATNLAVEIAKITKENVALIDLNFQLGDITTFLDLKPSFNISYMLQNLDKLNSEFLLSTMEKYKDTSLYILADSPKDLKNKNTISINSLTKFFDILRDTFSYVIVDTSGGFDPFALKAIELSDLAFLLLVVNLPSLRNCQRYLEMFDETNDKKIKIIVNRYMENDEINSDEVEKILGKKLYWKIPNNYFTMMSANNKGVPVSTINPDSNVALNIKNLALNISEKNYRG